MKKIKTDLSKLKLFIDNFISENGRLPMMYEFRISNGSPYSQGVIEKEYGGIQNICKLLNIEFKKNSNNSLYIEEDSLKNFVNIFLDKNNKLPLASDFTKANNAPCCFETLIKKHGSLEECFKKLGFNTNLVRTVGAIIDDNVMLQFINKYNKSFGVNPGINDFKKRLGCPYNKSLILKHYGSIEKLYIHFNLSSKPISKTDIISDKELLDNLLVAIYKHRTTDRDELRNLSSETIFDRSVYERRFGSWSNAVEKANFTIYNRCLLAYFINYKGEEPIEFLKQNIGTNGDFTEKQKYYLNNVTDKYHTIRKHFKSINFYYILLGKEIKMANNIVIKQIAVDGHVCDSNSEKIVDDFLHVNKLSHKIHGFYPNSKMLYDFKVNDVYVEYAGMYGSSDVYDEKIKTKIDFAKVNNLKLYVLYNIKQSSLNDMKEFINNNCHRAALDGNIY